MPGEQPRRTYDLKTIEAAADLAKSHAEHWEHEALIEAHDEPVRISRRGRPPTPKNWDAKTKAGHWRIIEKEIRGMADTKPDTERR